MKVVGKKKTLQFVLEYHLNRGRPGRTGEANMYSTNKYNDAGYHLYT